MAATVTAAANLYVTHINARKERELAQTKYEQTRLDERDRRLSKSIAELSGHLTRGYQKQTWIVWTARKLPALITDKSIADYDASMQEILPQAIVAHVDLANQDRKLFFEIAPVVREFGNLDAELSEILAMYRGRLPEAREKLSQLHFRLQDASSRLGRRISGAYLGIATDEGAPTQATAFSAPARAYACPSGPSATPCLMPPDARVGAASGPSAMPTDAEILKRGDPRGAVK